MKKLSIIAGIASFALFLGSCAPVDTTLQKDIRYMGIRFKPLSRADLTLVGNLQAEVTITGKNTRQGKTLDKTFSSNMKEGKFFSQRTEMLYFAPGAGEAITGDLYENDIFNTITASSNQSTAKRTSFLAALFPGIFHANHEQVNKGSSDAALDFAYYAIIAKYPDVDYFINVRFDRKTVVKGSSFSETVIVRADGVKLKTD